MERKQWTRRHLDRPKSRNGSSRQILTSKFDFEARNKEFNTASCIPHRMQARTGEQRARGARFKCLLPPLRQGSNIQQKVICSCKARMHVGVIHCLEQANAPFLSTFLMYPWAECDGIYSANFPYQIHVTHKYIYIFVKEIKKRNDNSQIVLPTYQHRRRLLRSLRKW